MPCTLQPWEIAIEEQRANGQKFQRELTDQALMEEVACMACRFLKKKHLMSDAPVLIQKWWRLHEEKDKKDGRK